MILPPFRSGSNTSYRIISVYTRRFKNEITLKNERLLYCAEPRVVFAHTAIFTIKAAQQQRVQIYSLYPLLFYWVYLTIQR